MGLSHSPRIVTDGLVFCVDAANPRSYPGAGTTLSDLSHNPTNLTLYNGLSYSDEGNGSLLFDGTDDYASGSINNTTTTFPSVSGGFTISFWLNQVTELRDPFIFRLVDTGGNTIFNVSTRPEPAGYVGCRSENTVGGVLFQSEGGPGSSWPVGEWYHCTFVYRGTTSANDLDWYFNGVETLAFGWNYRYRFHMTSPTYRTNDGGPITMGYNPNGNPTDWLNSYIANLQLYNRTLTDDETKQNYNATRWRFQ